MHPYEQNELNNLNNSGLGFLKKKEQQIKKCLSSTAEWENSENWMFLQLKFNSQ